MNAHPNPHLSANTVLVLGANGRFGQAVSRAFAAAGWTVLAHSRRPLTWMAGPSAPGIETVSDPLDSIGKGGPSDRRYTEVTIVVHAMNPIYTEWATQALPLAQRAAEIAESLGATLMFPGNVYNYGDAMPEVLRENTKQDAHRGKGQLRVWIENLFEQRSRAGLKTIVVRAGDFFGVGTGSWFDKVVTAGLNKARITYPGDRSVPHAWAYLPDLAQVFVRLAVQAGKLPAYSVFHFAGHTLTGDQFVSAIENAARTTGHLRPAQRVKVRGLPWSVLRIAGWFSRMPRELVELKYLWFTPHRLDDSRLRALLGAPTVDALTTRLDLALGHSLGPPSSSA